MQLFILADLNKKFWKKLGRNAIFVKVAYRLVNAQLDAQVKAILEHIIAVW